MDEYTHLESFYQRYIQDLGSWLPDGITQIDMALLHRLNLLDFEENFSERSSKITHYFHVIESSQKVTLFNERFVVWIVPEMVDDKPTTYALVASNNNSNNDVPLELVFSATGVYNTSRLVLRVLEQTLDEIQDTEDELTKIN